MLGLYTVFFSTGQCQSKQKLKIVKDAFTTMHVADEKRAHKLLFPASPYNQSHNKYLKKDWTQISVLVFSVLALKLYRIWQNQVNNV